MRISVITLTLAASIALAFLVVGAFPPQSGAGPCDDPDGDSVCTPVDNCTAVANTAQNDSNSDGYGNVCDADYNNDTGVGVADKGMFDTAWGSSAPGPPYDADVDCNSDGGIGVFDKGCFDTAWGKQVGPSGLSCAGTTPCP